MSSCRRLCCRNPIAVIFRQHKRKSYSFSCSLSTLVKQKPLRNNYNYTTISTLDDTYNCNITINRLGCQGRVQEARNLFDKIPHPDSVSYASMISAYLKNNDLHSAETLFQAMQAQSLRNNIVAESAMVDGYAKAGLIDQAKKVFDEMSEKNVFSWTSLISGYFRKGLVEEGSRLFEQMPVKNVVSWTTVVMGYARNGYITEARKFFYQMPEKNVIAWTTMIKAYIEDDQVDEALELFCQMPERNLYSWNVIISGCFQAGRVNEAVRLFNSLPQRNAVTWTTMVTGLARHKMIESAWEYFDQMPNKDVAAWNAMLKVYIDDGLMIEAEKLFNKMPERSIVTWNTMIDGYARNGPGCYALKLLVLMRQSGYKPNQTTLTSILTACQSLLEVIQMHSLGFSLGFLGDTSLANALVTAYARNGEVESAKIAFDSIDFKDAVSWTAMILAYSNHGLAHFALQVFACMLRAGAKPDEITFVGLLSACNHAGLVEKGEKLFHSMSRAYDLEPRAEHYTCLVDILGRAGRMEEAMAVVQDMPSSKRDGMVFGALLGACRLHGNVELASHLGEELIELEPSWSGGYVLLANVFAAHGKWDEFARVRKKMKERNVQKVPGYSQIEVNGRNHVFVVGRRNHPQVEHIHGLLMQELLSCTDAVLQV